MFLGAPGLDSKALESSWDAYVITLKPLHRRGGSVWRCVPGSGGRGLVVKGLGV